LQISTEEENERSRLRSLRLTSTSLC